MFILGPVWLLRLSGGNFLLVTGASRQICLGTGAGRTRFRIVRSRLYGAQHP